VSGSVIHFAEIFHLSCSIQNLLKNFMLLQQLGKFLIVGPNMTHKIVFANLDAQQGQLLEKINVI
jgi:hypothetical protein